MGASGVEGVSTRVVFIGVRLLTTGILLTVVVGAGRVKVVFGVDGAVLAGAKDLRSASSSSSVLIANLTCRHSSGSKQSCTWASLAARALSRAGSGSRTIEAAVAHSRRTMRRTRHHPSTSSPSSAVKLHFVFSVLLLTCSLLDHFSPFLTTLMASPLQ
ncbi:hypothetical protein AAT19DRAFT_9671 [Rhodotorula toruloides]|uniref:Uncharacterized protein n=1 Tax=Rhodotorula toruloides TaxID=5286 RepID=A0A2T0A2V1_RHOTO|nr:hypothetical protein AAT19DRAFT_9671 [Rhodotorula toruloides]